MTTGKTIPLTRLTFVDKVMSLLFNMLSRLVITFLLRSKRLLISWLQLLSAVILEPKKMNSVTVYTVSPSICHEAMEPDAVILVFWMLRFKPTFHSSLSLSFFKFFYFFIFFICSEFCHTSEWNSPGFTCVPHPDPPSHLPLHPLPLGFPSAPGPSTCLMHPTWAGDLFHPRYYTCFDAVLLKHPTLSFSHRV